MSFYRLLLTANRLIVAMVAISATIHARADAIERWSPEDLPELPATTPPLDPESGAEILLHDAKIFSNFPGPSKLQNYFRLLIYNQRGVEELRAIRILYKDSERLKDLAIRVIEPDGSIINVPKQDTYNSRVIKSDDGSLWTTSFSPPSLVPGAILEYRYTLTTKFIYAVDRLNFQSELPCRHVRYKVHTTYVGVGTSYCLSFNCLPFSGAADREGFSTYELSDVPRRKMEPFEIPSLYLAPTAILYFLDDFLDESRQATPEKLRSNIAANFYKSDRYWMKKTRTVRKALEYILSSEASSDPLAKLTRIHDYCRTTINNTARLDSTLTGKRSEDLIRSEHASDTIEYGYGTPRDINRTFVALARAAGFESQEALVANRSIIFVNESSKDPFSFPDLVAAVKVNDTWILTDPGATYLPFGVLDRYNSDNYAMVAASEGAKMQFYDGPPPEFSTCKRTGNFTIDDSGTLDGDASITLTGYTAATYKSDFADKTDQARLEALRDDLRRGMPSCELTEVHIHNIHDPLADIEMRFHLRVTNYADCTSSRLFFQPAIFDRGIESPFTAEKRTSAISFPNRCHERDELIITVPQRYKLESGNAPPKLDVAGFGAYNAKISYNPKESKFVYTRDFKRSTLLIDASKYAIVRQIYDGIKSRDDQTLTLRRESETPSVSTPEMTAPKSAR